MAIDFRFKRINSSIIPELQWQFEGKTLSAAQGDTVAAALLLNGIDYTRTSPVSQQPRAPFCLMGTCFECLMEVDGVPNQQACQVLIKDGMNVKRMRGARMAHHD